MGALKGNRLMTEAIENEGDKRLLHRVTGQSISAKFCVVREFIAGNE
jgi:hypothetical protein